MHGKDKIFIFLIQDPGLAYHWVFLERDQEKPKSWVIH